MFMISVTQKLLAQTIFLAAGMICLKMGERTIADALIFGALGTLVPVAEKRDQRRHSSLPAGESPPRSVTLKED